MSDPKHELHAQLDALEAQGVNFQRIMVAHALVEAGHVGAIECTMPRCIYESRRFEPKIRALGLSIDHIIPQSQGGSHHPDNLRLAHLGCNSSAATFDESRKAVITQTAKRTRRAQRYAQRNAEVRGQSAIPVRDDQWLDAWVEKNRAWQWLASTRDMQMRVYHFNVDGMVDDELADYILWNALALTDELHEFLAEVQWKDWALDRGHVNREEAVSELVDVGHFLGNLLVVLGVSDDEWLTRYQEKQMRNAERQHNLEGYSGRKCPRCHRALDDPGAVVTRNGEGIGHGTFAYCSRCDARIEQV